MSKLTPQDERGWAQLMTTSFFIAAQALGSALAVDFAAGNVPRAPAWMRRAGVEWGFRLLQEPGRMWRRYVLGNPLFVGRILLEAVSRPRSPP